jgi:cathepsin O
MKCLLLLVSWTACLHAQLSPEWSLFQDFIRRYGKTYANDTELTDARFSAFKESLRRQQWLNRFEGENGGSAVYGVNKFSDLTTEEFKQRYLSGLKASSNQKPYHSPTPPHLPSSMPSSFDWRKKKVIGQIWNQEECGSCWAFATVETIASRYAIQTGHLWELSAQQLISCDTGVDLDGCKGGALEVAFGTIKYKDIIIVNASVYPFTSGDGKSHTCRSNLPTAGVRLLDFNYTSPMLNETEMQYYLLKYSPLTVSVNARAWQDYNGGIIQHHCSSASVDHAVQVVGYNLKGPIPYWIVRNTWGEDWGENGYLRLKFGQNTCGMTSEVVFVKDVMAMEL